MKIIFFGSDDFALAHLEALLKSGHKVSAIVTQPDKPRDRGMKVRVSPLKERGLDAGIKIFQPEDLKAEDLAADLRDIQADIYVVVSYGRFLPPVLLNIPPRGAINVHASLLPKYRGAAPINWAIINGENETGLTIFKLNPQMDAGDMIAQVKIPIPSYYTSAILRDKMKAYGPCFLLDTLESMEKGNTHYISQENAQVSYAPKITREIGGINWNKPAVEIDRLVRGLLPNPAAYTLYDGEILKILEAEIIGQDIPGASPGQVVLQDKHSFAVQTGKGCLRIKKLQLASG
jgi:methionyl-tRNA formyltransferase